MPSVLWPMQVFDPNAEDGMLKQCESWKHFTAHEINRRIGESGPFWQQDGFDHLVRTEDQFHAIRKYISGNASKANLASGEYRHFSKDLQK